MSMINNYSSRKTTTLMLGDFLFEEVYFAVLSSTGFLITLFTV
jgi:hypothetical protein